MEIESFITFSKNQLPADVEFTGKSTLVEIGTNFTGTIALSYFTRNWLNAGEKLIGFKSNISEKPRQYLLNQLLSRVSLDNGIDYPFRLARSIGINGFIFPKKSLRDSVTINALMEQTLQLDKEQLLELELDGNRIGDLFYDWHLRKRGLATINNKTDDFRYDFKLFLRNYFFWDRILDEKTISNIVVSHTVYLQGILVRLGLKRGINVFLISYDRVYRLSKEFVHSDLEFRLYDPQQMVQLGYQINLQRAGDNLEKLGSAIDPNFGVPGLVSGLHGEVNSVVLGNSPKLKVLIAPHCFSDSPHALGDLVFPDYMDWLLFICKISKELDYDWFIKPHPAFFESDKRHFASIIAAFPNLKLVEASISNIGLFKQGLDAVVTTQGSIGFEAASFGVLAINASINAPSHNYSFNLFPRTKFELQNMLIDLESIKSNFVIDRKEILHFYDLQYLRRKNSWLFKKSGDFFFNSFRNYYEIFESPRVFEIWINNIYSDSLDAQRIIEVQQFLEKGDYQMEVNMNTI